MATATAGASILAMHINDGNLAQTTDDVDSTIVGMYYIPSTNSIVDGMQITSADFEWVYVANSPPLDTWVTVNSGPVNVRLDQITCAPLAGGGSPTGTASLGDEVYWKDWVITWVE